MEGIDRLAFRLFGEHVQRNEDSYRSVRRDLNSSNQPVPWDVYVTRGYLYSLITGILCLALLGAVGYLLVNLYTVPSFVRLPGALAAFKDVTAQNRTMVIAVIGAILGAPIVSGVTFFLYLSLPKFRVYNRARNIGLNLHSAVTFLYAMSRGGANIIDAFRELSESENAYGAVSGEASLILRDMEFFGEDINTALRNRVEGSPSSEFGDFCASLISILDSGGDVTKFLKEKADEYERQSIQELESYLETLGLLAETYTTAFVAGPIFIIIMTSVMTLMQGGGGGAATMALYVTAYAVLPIGAAMFIILIDMLSPEEAASEFEVFELEKAVEHGEELDGVQKKRLKRMQRGERLHGFLKRLKRPHKPFMERPVLSLAFSVPLALTVLVAGYWTLPPGGMDVLIDHMDDYAIASGLIAITPLSVFHELNTRRLEGIRKRIPELISQLASMNEMGLNLVEAFHHVGGGSDALSREMRKVQRELSWGEEISVALKRFTNRIRSARLLQVVTLITRALRASGNVARVLRIAADDEFRRRELERQRSTQIFVYVVIIYLSFLVFLAIIGILAVKFLPVMQQPAAGGGAAGASMGGMGLGGGLDVELFKRTFFHAAVVQGFSSGLVAGKMGEGAVLSGLKHSILMVLVAYAAFIFVL